MTAKERVLKTLAREVADSMPVNYSANAGIDERLKRHYGLRPNDGEGLLRALHVDFRWAGPPYIGPRLHLEIPGRGVDAQWGWRTRWIEHSSGGYWDFCDFPLQNADEETIHKWPMPSSDDYDYDNFVAQCQAHREFAVHIGDPGLVDIMNSAGFLFGTERILMDLMTEEPVTLDFIDRRQAVRLEVTRRALEKAKGLVDFMWIGEDLGTQIGPLISLDLFRRVIRPRHQKFIDLAKALGLPVMIHCCGSSSWAFDDFIAMGINAVDTLQPEAKDMSPAYLKKRYGHHLAFHGCISTAGPVAGGTVDKTRRYCREIMDVMMPGGGYCFAPTHALQDNSPTENVVAMYETALEFGRY